jgi:hypothetical protein
MFKSSSLTHQGSLGGVATSSNGFANLDSHVLSSQAT